MTRDDLRDLETALGGALSGEIEYQWHATTQTGARCFKLLSKLRHRYFCEWAETVALRAHLSRSIANEQGLRDTNQLLTEQIDRLERHLQDLRKVGGA